MSDIFVMVRSHNNRALTSVEGIPFVVHLRQHDLVLAKEVLDLIYADAGFDDLKLGQYTVVIQHEQVEPQEASLDVSINRNDQVILLTFVYLEAERVLLRTLSSVEKRL